MSRRIKRVQKKTDEQTYESFIFGELTGGLGNQLFVIFTTFGKGLDFNYKPEILMRGLGSGELILTLPCIVRFYQLLVEVIMCSMRGEDITTLKFQNPKTWS